MKNLLKLLPRVIENNRRAREVGVVLFGEGGSNFLRRAILFDIDHFLVRPRELNILTFGVVMRFIFNLRLIFKDVNQLPIFMRAYVSMSNLRRLYLYACICEISPKVVITFMDTDYDFQWIGINCIDVDFLAIQNGVREQYSVSKWLPPQPHPASKICLQHFYCFGDVEPALLSKFGHRVKNFYPVGSLRASYYADMVSTNPSPGYDFDVCFVSQWISPDRQAKTQWPETYAGVLRLCEYLNKYVMDKKISLAVALRTGDLQENQYYRSLFGKNATLVSNDGESMASYKLADGSKVVITGSSTLGWEAFSWGKRVMFCNLSGDEAHDFPFDGLWRLCQPSYDEFSKRLDAVLVMKDESFYSYSKDVANKVMRNPYKAKAHLRIRRDILGFLKS